MNSTFDRQSTSRTLCNLRREATIGEDRSLEIASEIATSGDKSVVGCSETRRARQ